MKLPSWVRWNVFSRYRVHKS